MRLARFLDEITSGQYEACGELPDYQVKIRVRGKNDSTKPEIVTDHEHRTIWL